MKVVLFCGGLGTRLREHSDTIPKPLVNVGYRPIMWHLMRYYAHFGHTEFILCLGYRGDLVREYFLRYVEAMSNDFTLHGGDRRVVLHSRDIDDWKITFIDTGLHSNIGQRLMRVRKYVQDEEAFLANYADGLSDLPLDQHISRFEGANAVGSLVAVTPCAMLCKVCLGQRDLAAFARNLTREQMKALGFPRDWSKRIHTYLAPSETTFVRLLRHLKQPVPATGAAALARSPAGPARSHGRPGLGGR